MNFLAISNNIVDPLVNLIFNGADNWMSSITFGSILLRIMLAILFGGILGIERAAKKHAAGFRTYILCCVGAAAAGMLNQFIVQSYEIGDAARLGAGVISGIGFICAGSILTTSRNQIKGITTAASLWASGCVGVAIGHGFYTFSIIACLAIFFVLHYLPKLEHYFTGKASHFTVYCELGTRTDLKPLIHLLRERGIQIKNVEHNSAYSQTGLSVYSIEVDIPKEAHLTQQEAIQLISEQEYVNFAEKML